MTGATEDVELGRLSFGLSPRLDERDDDHVAVLAEVITQLPPIVVHAPSMQVIDGVHRVLAARSLGHTTIPAVFFHGDEHEAAIRAIVANVDHGKPLTLQERQRAAEKVVKLHPNWSDRRIATVCGLSPKTVAGARQRATADVPQLRARLGRDGRARATDPIALRQKIAAALEADPEASIRAIAARTGAAQGTVRDVRDRLQRGVSILAPRLERALRKRAEDNGDSAWLEDQALRSQQESARFAEWFEQRLLADDGDWEDFLDAVPMSRVYEVADAARRCAKTWESFAAALESRVRARRRR